VFFVATVVWAIIRGFQPDINGLEKFMDFGFMQSILQSRSFPPHDMWFAGGSINYYYFGHYLSAVMTMVSGMKPAVAYNLMIATLFGLSVSGAVSVGGSVVSQIQNSKFKIQNYGNKIILIGGLVAAFLLAVRGNLHTAGYWVNKWIGDAPLAWPFGTPHVGTSLSWLPSAENVYWYPDATRYIPFTIHEFPMYSYVVADLHAHVINIPLVLLFLGGVVVVVSRNQEVGIRNQGLLDKVKKSVEKLLVRTKVTPPSLPLARGGIRWYEVLTLGWLLGVFAMTNAWDVPIYGVVTGVTLFILNIKNQISKIQIKNQMDTIRMTWNVIKELVPVGISLVFLALLVSLPFQLNFEQIAEGIRPVEATSEISKLLILWGWDLFLFVSLAVFVFYKFKIKNEKLKIQIKSQNFSNFEFRISNLMPWDWVILAWYLVGWLLILIPEFIYVKDIYIADYHRANTMFKLVYQSWVLFAICGSYAILRLTIAWVEDIKNQKLNIKNTYQKSKIYNRNFYLAVGKFAWMTVILLGLFAVGSYSIFAIEGYYGNLDGERYRGLDGERWLAERYPDDYEGIEWVRNQSQESRDKNMESEWDWPPVVLEAVGESYTEFGRVSAYTGLPTVEGWTVHEWLWRGAYDMPGARLIAVEHLYNAQSLDETVTILNLEEVGKQGTYSGWDILKMFKVRYVFAGAKEREKYPSLNEDKFAEVGVLVFESGETRIYEFKVQN
jgi:YYY domain-containing protein